MPDMFCINGHCNTWKVCLTVEAYSAQATCHLPCFLQGIDQCCSTCYYSGLPVTPRFCFTKVLDNMTWIQPILVWTLMATMLLTFLNFAKHHTGINKNWCATENTKLLSLTMIKLIMISPLYVTLWTLPLGHCMSVFGISQADLSPKQLLVP